MHVRKNTIWLISFLSLIFLNFSQVEANDVCKRQIIAIGGSTFNIEPNNLEIDRYILAAVRHSRTPKVGFISSPKGGGAAEIQLFHRAYRSLGAETSHFDGEGATLEEFQTFISDLDVIYVGGGDTLELIQQWKEAGYDQEIRKAYDRGVVLGGVSAGGMCWFQEGVSDSEAAKAPGEKYGIVRCMGIIPGSFTPHYEWQPERQQFLARALTNNEIRSGYAVDDHAALHFVDEGLSRVVSAHPEKTAGIASTDASGAPTYSALEPRILKSPETITVREPSTTDIEKAKEFVSRFSDDPRNKFKELFDSGKDFFLVFAYRNSEIVGVAQVRPGENKEASLHMVSINDLEVREKLVETAVARASIANLTIAPNPK